PLWQGVGGRAPPGLAPARRSPAGLAARAVAVADFNGDGVPDLAVANLSNPGTVSILLASGGGYLAPVDYYAGFAPTDVIAADFNGDNIQGLVVVNYASSNNVFVLKGNGNGTFQLSVSYTVADSPWAVVAGDFDADDDLDLATANYYGQNVSILRNAGDGTFTSAG